MLDSPIRTHGQCQNALGPGQPPGALYEALTSGRQSFKFPQRRSLFCRPTLRGADLHLGLAVQVVGHDHRQEKRLVAIARTDRNVVHLPLGLQLGKDPFLRAAPFVVSGHVARANRLVRHDHFESKTVDLRNEEIELQRPGTLLGRACTNRKETISTFPYFGLPRQLEPADVVVQAPPVFPHLDTLLQLKEPLERHRDREFDSLFMQEGNDGVAEEGAIHASLDRSAGEDLANLSDTGEDELPSAIGVMDVPRSVMEVEHLARLSDGAEQRIIAALPFLFLVETDSRSLCLARRAHHGAIKIEGDAPHRKIGQALENEISQHRAEFFDSPRIELCQKSAYRADIGKAFKSENPENHRIVLVEGDVSQLSVPEQDVNNETEKDGDWRIVRLVREMAQALPTALPQSKIREEDLEEQEPGERAEFLDREFELGESAGFAHDLFSAKLHGDGLSWIFCVFCHRNYNPSEAVFFVFFSLSLSLTRGEVWQLRKIHRKCWQHVIYEDLSGYSMQLPGSLAPAKT